MALKLADALKQVRDHSKPWGVSPTVSDSIRLVPTKTRRRSGYGNGQQTVAAIVRTVRQDLEQGSES